MQIDARLSAYPAAAALAAPAARMGGTRFSLPPAGARDAAAARSAAPLATLDAILMLQQEDPREHRRRQARRGQDLLAALDRLKAGLLAGTISRADLEAIATTLAAGTGPTGDPALDETMAAIELRAKVELAKLARA